ncbi:MAG TPA: 3-deoxy-manno-octulosonate cytidylyltransferase [Rhizomicrobium sp.]
MSAVVVIPARMASTRLPGKPLADIGGMPIIVRVWRQAMKAEVGRVVVAAAEAEIVDAVTKAGGLAVLTHPDLPSGTDRVFAALEAFAGGEDIVVNLQGDLPALEPAQLRTVCDTLANSNADIATLVAEIEDPTERENPNVVKAVVAWDAGSNQGRALYFTRASAPSGDGALFHHVGIYAFRRAALARFVALPPSPLERRERLEQLRALEAGMHIRVAKIDGVPLSVDTPDDLARARTLLAARQERASS